MESNNGGGNSNGGGGEPTTASSKKALAKVYKMLQLVAIKRHALGRRDYHDILNECLQPETSAEMKIAAFRLASCAPSCATHEIFQLLLKSILAEMAGASASPPANSVLVHALPVLERIPIPLVLGVLVTPDKEPMNRLRSVLQHAQNDVRCIAVASLARVTLAAAVQLTQHDGMFAFPLESHEARVMCQQDVATILVDVWKLIFRCLLAVEAPALSGMFISTSTDTSTATMVGSDTPSSPEVASAAFAAMRMLFAQTSRMVALKEELRQASRSGGSDCSAANDLAAAMFKEASPRILLLVANAQGLPIQGQVNASWWLASLLFMMMERSGAQCPGVSVPLLTIDSLPRQRTEENDDEDDDQEDHARVTTKSVRIDQLAATTVLDAWLLPLLKHKASLSQRAELCRAVFLLLSHPLQRLTRQHAAPILVRCLIAQCAYQSSRVVKLEMTQLLVKTFAWVVNSTDCLTLFPRVVHALLRTDSESDRKLLLHRLMDDICERVLVSREFLLFESICSLHELFPCSPQRSLSTRSQHLLFQALIRSLVAPDTTSTPLHAEPTASPERQVFQLIALQRFLPLLTAASMGSHHPDGTGREDKSSSVADRTAYVVLLTQHIQRLVRFPSVTLRESLEFFHSDVLHTWPRIVSRAIRVQLLWLAIHVHVRYQVVPLSIIVELVRSELARSFTTLTDDEREARDVDAAAVSALDGGRLGDRHAPTGDGSDENENVAHGRDHDPATLAAFTECLAALAALDTQHTTADFVARTLNQLHQFIRHDAPHHGSLRSFIVAMRCSPSSWSVDNSRSACMSLQPQFDAGVLFPHAPPLVRASRSWSRPRHEQLLTGNADPFALRVSYRQDEGAGHEHTFTLCVSSCNTTSLPMTAFTVRIQPRGAVKCVDASNDLCLRTHDVTGPTASGLAPFAVLQGEKRFRLQRFAPLCFFLQLEFQEMSEPDGDAEMPLAMGEPSTQPLRLAPTDAFHVPMEVLFQCCSCQVTAAQFQTAWRCADDRVTILVASGDADDSEDKASPLSFAQRLLRRTSDRVVVVTDLLVDLSMHTQICFLAHTRWGDVVTATLTMTALSPSPAPPPSSSSSRSLSPSWSGSCELRSTSANVRELSTCASQVMTMLTGDGQLRLVAATPHKPLDVQMDQDHGVFTTQPPSTRDVPVDPFADDDQAIILGGSLDKWIAAEMPNQMHMEDDGDEARAPSLVERLTADMSDAAGLPMTAFPGDDTFFVTKPGEAALPIVSDNDNDPWGF